MVVTNLEQFKEGGAKKVLLSGCLQGGKERGGIADLAKRERPPRSGRKGNWVKPGRKLLQKKKQHEGEKPKTRPKKQNRMAVDRLPYLGTWGVGGTKHLRASSKQEIALPS